MIDASVPMAFSLIVALTFTSKDPRASRIFLTHISPIAGWFERNISWKTEDVPSFVEREDSSVVIW